MDDLKTDLLANLDEQESTTCCSDEAGNDPASTDIARNTTATAISQSTVKARSGGSVDWFSVDKTGLAQTLARRPKEFVPFELVQNAFDENVSRVEVTIAAQPGSPMTIIQVKDDAPDGIRQMEHIYTLYAPSAKKDQPQQRGRFNSGEKSAFSMARSATVVSVNGALRFDKDGRKKLRQRTERGTVVTLELRLTAEERRDCEAAVSRLIVPAGITLLLNGVEVPHREACGTFQATLPTEKSDQEGNLRRTSLKTTVHLHRPREGEVAAIFELGIPVVETGDLYHVDVQQKVPLNADRDNVTPAYLALVRTLVLNHMHADVEAEDARTEWVNAALSHHSVSSDAVRTIMEQRFGDKAVTYDPSDPESNKRAVSEGYTVVPGGSFSAVQWQNVRKAAALLPAGRVTPSPKPFDENGLPLRLLPEDRWSEAERRMVTHYHILAEILLGVSIKIKVADQEGWSCDAAFGGRELYLNRVSLGREFFEGGLSEEAISLLIHELGHHYCGDHLSRDYYDALTTLGARLARAVANNPALLPL